MTSMEGLALMFGLGPIQPRRRRKAVGRIRMVVARQRRIALCDGQPAPPESHSATQRTSHVLGYYPCKFCV